MQKILGYALIVLSILLIMSFLSGLPVIIKNISNLIFLFSGKLSSFEAGELAGTLFFNTFHIFLIMITMKYGRRLIK